MERRGHGDSVMEEQIFSSRPQFDGDESVLSSNFFLDRVGEVVLTLNSAGLSWKLAESVHDYPSTCLGIKLVSNSEAHIKFCDVYAVEFINWGLVHGTIVQTAMDRILGHELEMYRFAVHGVKISQNQPSTRVLTMYIFGHKDFETCHTWMNQINAYLKMKVERPTSLLVFVHPMSGRGNGLKTWDVVAPIFSRAEVKTKVIVTQKAGHAFDVMASITSKELNSYNGVVAVGGDGFFNEILNGLLTSRHKAPYPPAPADFNNAVRNDGNVPTEDPNDSGVTCSETEDNSPLLSNSDSNGPRSLNLNQDPDFALPNESFRFGIIPAGSTDAIVICSTGARDPITSALHIVLGKKVCLDIAQVVRWKTTSTSEDEIFVRYAASFAGYGFYGDVITESEKYRWMGPKRYDYAGTKVFLKHRSYEAEISYLEVESEKKISVPEQCSTPKLCPLASDPQVTITYEREICRVNCPICNANLADASTRCPATTYLHPGKSRWLKSKGRFLSIGAAVISCRNEKAPDGLVADAHLSDGFLHLILIKDCPHALYLWHLTELTKKNGNPLKFDFIEHHKTPAFTFVSLNSESVWNLDGELFKAHKLSAQVFRGLISLFAPGPEI